MSFMSCGGPNPGEVFVTPSPRADAGEEVYALVDEKWVLVKVQKRKTDWILFSCTYRYDVLQGKKGLLDIPQSDIMTVEDYKKKLQDSKGTESEKTG